jgi:SAM-dependent methyltransferase
VRRARGEPNWPKRLPVLTKEQESIRADFYRVWLATLPRRYKPVDWFHHIYPARRPPPPGGRTLEVGAGFGNQIQYEDLSRQEYVAVDLREEMVAAVRERYPEVEAVVADAQRELPFDSRSFDRVLAVQVLEHMPNLPAALDEIARVLKPSGRFVVVIPCEGGWAYSLARSVSARPLFERRYNSSYDWLIASEHCNLPWEVDFELRRRFRIAERTYFPVLIPSVNLNLLIGLTCVAAPGGWASDQA